MIADKSIWRDYQIKMINKTENKMLLNRSIAIQNNNVIHHSFVHDSISTHIAYAMPTNIILMVIDHHHIANREKFFHLYVSLFVYFTSVKLNEKKKIDNEAKHFAASIIR